MAGLPELPDRIQKLHALRWKKLIEELGFAGDHLKWHESRDRRHRAAKPRYSLAPPPSWEAGDRHSHSDRTFPGPSGERISHGEWHKNELAAWVAREDDPEVVDSIGTAETTTLAKAVFSVVAQDYFSNWADNSLDSEEFGVWLEGVEKLVMEGIIELWRKDDWHTAWFNRAARKKLEDALAVVIKEWVSRAEAREIKHLENPHLDTVASSASGSRPICSDWRSLPPDDPRYRSWQLILGVLQRDESQATANIAVNFKRYGEESAVLTLVQEKFDACGRAGLMLVSSVAEAQDLAEVLTKALELTLAAFTPMFQVCEGQGISAKRLSKQARTRLTDRLAHWKTQAFQCGLEGGLRGLNNDSEKIEPAVEGERGQPDAAATALKGTSLAADASPQITPALNESEVPATVLPGGAPAGRKTTDEKEPAEEKIEVTRNPKVLSGSHSARDADIHKIVGEESFRTLTNAESICLPN